MSPRSDYNSCERFERAVRRITINAWIYLCVIFLKKSTFFLQILHTKIENQENISV